MSDEVFSYKEALAHGWGVTKKFWQAFLMVTVIYIFFQAVEGAMENNAGEERMSREAVSSVYENSPEGDKFYAYLQEEGYIDEIGRVQSKLQDMASPSDLVLPQVLEEKRADILKFLDKYRYRLPFPRPVFYLLSFILWLINMLMMIGLTRMTLMASRDQEPSASELFTNWGLFIPYLLGTLCYGLAVLGGFILLIIPGFIVMVMLEMYSYLIVDKGMGPIEALKRSRVITRGQRGKLFLFGCLLMLLNIAGLLCLVVGLFFTMWTSAVAMAYVYDRLEQAGEGDGLHLASPGAQ